MLHIPRTAPDPRTGMEINLPTQCWGKKEKKTYFVHDKWYCRGQITTWRHTYSKCLSVMCLLIDWIPFRVLDFSSKVLWSIEKTGHMQRALTFLNISISIIKGIVHFEMKIWYLSAYPKGIQDVGVFFSSVDPILMFLGQTVLVCQSYNGRYRSLSL